MPYKREYHKFTCPMCKKEYEVLTPAYLRKIKDKKYGSYCSKCRAKIQWDEMSDEKKTELQKKATEGKKRAYANMSDEKLNKGKEKRRSGNNKYWKSLTDEERKKISEKRSKDAKEYRSKLTEEEKREIGRKISATKIRNNENKSPEQKKAEKEKKQAERKVWWDRLSKEDKERICEILLKNNRKFHESMTPEQRAKHNARLVENGKRFWETVTQEMIDARSAKFSPKYKEYWEKLPEEDKKAIADRKRDSWYKNFNKMTDEEKEKFIKYASERNKLIRSKMTPEQIQTMIDKQKESIRKRRENLSPEQRYEEDNRLKKYLESLTPEERANITKKSLSHSSGKNKFHKKFEQMFKKSEVSNKFYIVPEVLSTNNDVAHFWDYGVFDKSNKKLVILIDLDGGYYHADKCDYNGIQSKEEYDEKRGLSVDKGVKICIIKEDQLTKSFGEMIKMTTLNYDKYIDSLFKTFRSIPFPQPSYSDKELINSWNNLINMKCDDRYHSSLSLNTRLGDRLIKHFHPSIYLASVKGHKSPYEAWYDDKLLRECIENRIIYQNHLNPNKILQGFNISKIAPKVSVFSAGRAKMIIRRYLDEFDEIFDPFVGFGGRMLGALACEKKYVGYDISDSHIYENIQMLKFLNIPDTNVCINVKDSRMSKGKFQSLFTCPPYSDKETWTSSVSSISDNTFCDLWIDMCIKNYHCNRYVFIVDKTTKYVKYIADEIINKSHFNKNKELVIVIDKMFKK